jgi:signal transduction histidine kinase
MRAFANAINQLLDVPSTDPDDARRRKLLNILLSGAGVLGFLALMVTVAADIAGHGQDIATYSACLALLVTTIIIFVINRYGAGWLASTLFLLFLIAALPFADSPQEVAEGRSLLMFAIPIMMGSVLLPPYASFIIAGLSGLVIAGIALSLQLVPNPFAILVFFWLALVSWLAARSLERALRDLRTLNLELEDRAERLQEMDRLKSQFMANMSHELRTPLNAILGFTQVVLMGIDGPLTEAQRTDLTAVHENSQHLLGLVTNVLDITRVQTGEGLDLAFASVNLKPLIEDIMSAATALVEDKPIELHQEVQPDLPSVWGDESRLQQVILNFLSNAAKFTDAGSITLRAWGDAEQVTVSVVDTGVGIAPEHQAIIFEEFRQVDGSLSRKAGGTGLGLPISRHLVEEHGGRIWVESAPGEGSTFSFTIPINPPQ